VDAQSIDKNSTFLMATHNTLLLEALLNILEENGVTTRTEVMDRMQKLVADRFKPSRGKKKYCTPTLHVYGDIDSIAKPTSDTHPLAKASEEPHSSCLA